MATVSTAAELGEALKNNKDTIDIEGNLAEKTIRIRATGKIAWAIAIGAIGLATYSVLTAPVTGPATGGGAQVASFGFVSVSATSILGASTTATAIAIAIASGGVGSLTSLRKYKEISRAPGRLVLKKR